MKKLLLALVIVALVAAPAFASVQNVKVSGSIDSTLLNRQGFDLGAASASNESDIRQNLFITQTNLQVDADLTDNVSATVALINERVWGSTASEGDTGIDLQLAYVTLREMLYSPLTVVIGRQALAYGNSLIVSSASTSAGIGNSGLSSTANDLSGQTGLDAVRAILDYDPLTVDIVYARLSSGVVTDAAGDPTNNDDTNLYGINATYELGDDKDTQVQAYVFAKRSRTLNGAANLGAKTDTVYVPGILVSTNPLEDVTLSVEYAHQSGTRASTDALDNQQRDADAAQLIASYAVPVLEDYNPVLQYSYTFTSGENDLDTVNASGNNGVNNEIITGWDPMLENQGKGTIYNALFALTNCQIHSISLTTNPIEDLTATLSWTGLWTAQKIHDSGDVDLFQPDGSATASTVNNVGVAGKDEIGNEIDLVLTYAYTEDVTIGANLGWFFPGDGIDADHQEVASQALINVNVDF
ncbi:MAG: alginate export family protein [Candidatus Zapsychrus exili]|nr:alginate export family protein [Candidatus Zapsychrus exili]